MTKTETGAYLVIVFPAPANASAGLATLATGIIRALTNCCSQPPQLVHPDKNKLALLVSGEYGAIIKALDLACQQHNDSWLLTQVGTPCAANGLSASSAWIHSHTQASKT